MAGFQDIVGQEQIKEHFLNAMKSDKISHAYIINGEEGSGKRTLAKALAMTLQCELGGSEPCMQCRSCKQSMTDNQPDIRWVVHEKPNSIGVEEIRDQLNQDIQLKPYSSRYKIYIINDADKLTVQAQNALLKTIEEPPHYAIILLLTMNSDRFLPTILSRCVLINMKPIPSSMIKKYLIKEKGIPDYKADLAVAFSQGNLGKAVKLSSSEYFNELKENVLQLMKYINEMDITAVVDAIKKVGEYKLEINDYIDLMLIWYRDILLFKATKNIDSLVFKDEVRHISEQASKCSFHGLELIIEAMDKAKIRLRANVNFDLSLELMLLTIKENMS